MLRWTQHSAWPRGPSGRWQKCQKTWPHKLRVEAALCWALFQSAPWETEKGIELNWARSPCAFLTSPFGEPCSSAAVEEARVRERDGEGAGGHSGLCMFVSLHLSPWREPLSLCQDEAGRRGAWGPFLGAGVRARAPRSPAALRRPEPQPTATTARSRPPHSAGRLCEIHANVLKQTKRSGVS